MNSYIYCADRYCEDCGELIKQGLDAEGKRPKSLDEHTFDSDEYPKGPYGPEEGDGVEHCGNHEACVNAIVLSDGSKIGAWLENSLTSHGIESVREEILSRQQEQNEVLALWKEWYAEELGLGDGPYIRGEHSF